MFFDGWTTLVIDGHVFAHFDGWNWVGLSLCLERPSFYCLIHFYKRCVRVWLHRDSQKASLFRAKESPLKMKSSSRKETFSMRCFLSSFLQSFSLILHLSRNVILNPAQRGRRRVSSAPFSAVVPAACRRMALATVNLPGLKITLFLASRILFVKINFWIRISAGQKCCSFNFGP